MREANAKKLRPNLFGKAAVRSDRSPNVISCRELLRPVTAHSWGRLMLGLTLSELYTRRTLAAGPAHLLARPPAGLGGDRQSVLGLKVMCGLAKASD